MPRTVQLYRIGSDPEALAVHVRAGAEGKLSTHLIPAPHLVGENRDLTLRSFIGCDGHAATMELRPPPCHNVQWHLIKIAYALDRIRFTLDQERLATNITNGLLAQPTLNRETCGGHIWVSLYYKSKLSHDLVHRAGLVWSVDHHDFIRSGQAWHTPDDTGPLSRQTTQKYRDLATAGEELSVELCWRKLHHLLRPLEMTLFHTNRGAREGLSDPYYRMPNHQTGLENPALYRPGMAYFRFEYRFPTTWLSHPAMAFSYLGLAKLAVLNWDNLPSLPKLVEADNQASVAGLKKTGWRDLLYTRLQALKSEKGFRITNDLKGLDAALHLTTSAKINYPLFVDFGAWQQYNLSQQGG